MRKNNAKSNQAVIEARRRQVAALVLRGFSQREIQASLPSAGITNPSTGLPWSLGIVNSDVKALAADWKEAALADVDEHKARLLAEIREVRRKAWGIADLNSVLRALQQERDLLGADAPAKREHTGAGGGPIEVEAKGLAALLHGDS